MRKTNRLLNCLRHETEIARGIIKELDHQQRALLELNLAGLEASTVALEGLAGEMRSADEERMTAAQALAETVGLPAEAPLREILQGVSGPARGELEQVRSELKGSMEEIHHRNYANYVLMLNAARYNRAILQFVSGTSTTYSSDGAAEESGRTQSVVLNKKA